jgi:hypothetical protein
MMMLTVDNDYDNIDDDDVDIDDIEVTMMILRLVLGVTLMI